MKETTVASNATTADGLHAPGWIKRLVPNFSKSTSRRVDGEFVGTAVRSEGFGFVSIRFDDAVALSDHDFRALITHMYRLLGSNLNDLGLPFPLRLWNAIPGILETTSSHPHRYMLFNAGRFDGLRAWSGVNREGEHDIPTATAIGHTGRSVVIHCLACANPGCAIENPRQVPAYRYSDRYGPIPPCFARATMLPDEPGSPPLLLVGGTASVVGEDTRYQEDLNGQARETLVNLASIVQAAVVARSGPTITIEDALARYLTLRVHYVVQEHLPRIRQLLDSNFDNRVEIEWIHADLCRPDLLIEIEGVANLARSQPIASGWAVARLNRSIVKTKSERVDACQP